MRTALLLFVTSLCLASALVTVGTGSLGSAVASGTTPSPPIVRPGTVLNDTTLGIATAVDETDMVSPTLGYGVASGNGQGHNWYYLVATTNDATSWKVRGVLPFGSFSFSSDYFEDPTLHFISRDVGYASGYHGPVYVTEDAGATWAKVLTPGIWPTLVVAGSTASIVSDVCKMPLPQYGAKKCPSELSQYVVGTTTPLHSYVIPGEGVGPWRSAVALSAVSATSTVVVEGNGEGRASSLLISDDAGLNWRRLADPCEGLIVDQLIPSTPKGWLLYCFIDEGMSQGPSGLYSSSDAGASWSVVAKGSEQGKAVGNIGDFMLQLAMSNNKKIIVAGVDSAGGGIEYSTNGGVHWTRVNEAVSSGGSLETISTFGASGALLDVGDSAEYRTLNGTSWQAIAPLSAGRYRGLRVCTSNAGTKAVFGRTESGIPANSHDIPVKFTNGGNTPCYLDGAPNFSVTTGASRARLGPRVQDNLSGEPPYVVLKARGGTASVWLDVEAVTDYPKKYCDPKTFNGIYIQFPAPATYFLRTATLSLCTGVSTLTMSTVRSGLQTYQ